MDAPATLGHRPFLERRATSPDIPDSAQIGVLVGEILKPYAVSGFFEGARCFQVGLRAVWPLLAGDTPPGGDIYLLCYHK